MIVVTVTDRGSVHVNWDETLAVDTAKWVLNGSLAVSRFCSLQTSLFPRAHLRCIHVGALKNIGSIRLVESCDLPLIDSRSEWGIARPSRMSPCARNFNLRSCLDNCGADPMSRYVYEMR